MKKMAMIFASSMVFGVVSLVAMNEEKKEINSSLTTNSGDGGDDKEKKIEEKTEKKKETQEKKLNELLALQQYESILTILREGIYGGKYKKPFLIQWLKTVATSQYQVPLLYELFRYTIQSSATATLTPKQICGMMKKLILSIVLAKGDYEACCSFPDPEKLMKNSDPVGYLLLNYKHRLKEQYLKDLQDADKNLADDDSYLFANVVAAAKKEFMDGEKAETFYKNLPAPVWLYFVTNNKKWPSVWIDFPNVSLKGYLDIYKNENYFNQITSERKKAYKNTWKLFEGMHSWTELFDAGSGSVFFSKKYSDLLKENKEN